MSTNLKGTGVALVTPFNEDGSVDFDSLKKLLAYQLNNGVDYLVVNGTTAESATLREEETESVLTFVIKEVDNKVPVVYGMGGNNTSALI